jgi:hypothetical protein
MIAREYTMESDYIRIFVYWNIRGFVWGLAGLKGRRLAFPEVGYLA